MLENYNEELKADEVCEILSIGKNTFYKLLNSGHIAGNRVGKNWRVTKLSLIKYITQKTEALCSFLYLKSVLLGKLRTSSHFTSISYIITKIHGGAK